MAHDEGRRRFFGYFNLFIAAMLLLVLADNYLVLYVGWEGVGLASYLLIGFYYNRPTAATAGQEGLLRQPGRRRRAVDRDHADVRLLRHHLVRRRVREHDRTPSSGRRHRDRADAAARRVRQVRPVPAADLVAGRHGGPDPGVGADPRGNHGHRRRLPDRPVRADLQRLAGRAHRRHDRRRDHPALRVHLRASARTT